MLSFGGTGSAIAQSNNVTITCPQTFSDTVCRWGGGQGNFCQASGLNNVTNITVNNVVEGQAVNFAFQEAAGATAPTTAINLSGLGNGDPTNDNPVVVPPDGASAYTVQAADGNSVRFQLAIPNSSVSNGEAAVANWQISCGSPPPPPNPPNPPAPPVPPGPPGPPDPATSSSITIVKTAIKGSGTFTFVSPTPELAMSLTTGDTVSSGRIALAPGSYTITEIQDVPFFYLAEIACSDPDGGTRSSVSNATAVIDLDAGEHITCTFTNIDPRPQTKAIINRFMQHRLTALLDDEPDRPRFLRRFPGSLWGGGPGGDTSAPFSLAPSATGGNVAFSTSLGQISRAMASADTAKQSEAMALGGGSARNERPDAAPYGGIDIWTEAHFTAFEDDIGNGDAEGNFDILYIGADIPLNSNMIVGILGQFDWADESTKLDGSKTEGNGWMAGPYLSARLDQNLFFDWRAAWGTSDNSVSPFGTYTDNFDTTRWLTTARLTGNWTSGNWRLTPSATVKYAEEEQDAYTDTNGIRITSQTASLGRVEFGPEFGYRWTLADGTVIEPQMSFVGVWNFDNGGKFFVADTLVNPDDFTARIEGGLFVQLRNGTSLRGTAAYDGVGSNDYEAVTGKIWFNLPLN